MTKMDYFSLVRKSDGQEVYTSPVYTVDGCDNALDIDRIVDTLKFYFERVDSAARQKLEGGNLTEQQKSEIKFLNSEDYVIKYMTLTNEGGYSKKSSWTIEAKNWLKGWA